MTEQQSQLRQRAFGAILTNALKSPQFLFTILFTVVEAIFPVGWATVGDFFGRKSFAAIRGTMSFFYLWGPALGPVITGAVYDHYHSYAPMMPAFIVLALVASGLYASLVKPSSAKPQ